MNQRKIVDRKIIEFQIEEYIKENIKRAGLSKVKLQKTPLGEKIIIYASRPGLVVGRKGQNIKSLTRVMKNVFKLENPQIELAEVENQNLDSAVVAERIANSLEQFGSMRFKGIGHKTMENAMRSGALGIEILMSGKIPSTRAKTWRFYQGYLKKSGDISLTSVDVAYTTAHLKTGAIGVQVRIMRPDVILPDHIEIKENVEEIIEEVDMVDDKKSHKKPKKTAKKTSKPATSKTKKSKDTKEANKEVKDNKGDKKSKDNKTEDSLDKNTNNDTEETTGEDKQ